MYLLREAVQCLGHPVQKEVLSYIRAFMTVRQGDQFFYRPGFTYESPEGLVETITPEGMVAKGYENIRSREKVKGGKLVDRYLRDLDKEEDDLIATRKKVEALARRMEQAVHAIDPDVLLGCLAVYEAGDFFARGLRDGFKPPDRPVLIWTETPTYNKGYHAYVDDVYAKFQGLGNVIYVPGLNLAKHGPQTLGSQARDLALHSDGYWVFSQQKKRFQDETNLTSFKAGNGEILKALSTSE